MRFSQIFRRMLSVGCLLLSSGCSDTTSLSPGHISALTGQSCEPSVSYMPCGEEHFATVDCSETGSVDSCEFPRAGCDAQGCCDEDVVLDIGDGPPVSEPAITTNPEIKDDFDTPIEYPEPSEPVAPKCPGAIPDPGQFREPGDYSDSGGGIG